MTLADPALTRATPFFRYFIPDRDPDGDSVRFAVAASQRNVELWLGYRNRSQGSAKRAVEEGGYLRPNSVVALLEAFTPTKQGSIRYEVVWVQIRTKTRPIGTLTPLIRRELAFKIIIRR